MILNINDIDFNIITTGENTCKHWGSTMYHFDVEIQANGKSEHFDYYTGTARYFHDDEENDCAELIYCLFSDALSFIQNTSINDFAREFGYTDNVEECLKAYDGCRQEYNKIRRLTNITDERTLCRIVDTITRKYNV